FLLQGEIDGGMTTEPFIWGGWNSFWMVECGWQEYYPDVGGEANAGIACGLCSTRVEWSWPPDSSVWAWGGGSAYSGGTLRSC
ncbi:hypothetical protein JXA88_05630, partial [Candidatus Fermentibacteria bacterium]|nr:hypothetical protein [Candidatus Fermentibacteria bacterium]